MRSFFMIVAGFVALTAGTGAGAQTSTVPDPQAYCRTAGTVDMPDQQFAPDKTPEWMVAPFVNPQYPRAIYGISWRCMSGAVLVCQNAQSPSRPAG